MTTEKRATIVLLLGGLAAFSIGLWIPVARTTALAYLGIALSLLGVAVESWTESKP